MTTRREFMEKVTFASLGLALTGTALGCGDGSVDTDAGPPAVDAGPPAIDSGPPAVDAGSDAGPPCVDPLVDIGTNHRHEMVVTASEVSDGVEILYMIAGGGGHNHDVTLSAADFTTLAGGGVITIESTEAVSHTHTITVTAC